MPRAHESRLCSDCSKKKQQHKPIQINNLRAEKYFSKPLKKSQDDSRRWPFFVYKSATMVKLLAECAVQKLLKPANPRCTHAFLNSRE
jgi:hypothetical protein